MELIKSLGWQELAVRLGSAVVIGALRGLNRELQGKPASLRTNALVCLGAALCLIAPDRQRNEGTEPLDCGRG